MLLFYENLFTILVLFNYNRKNTKTEREVIIMIDTEKYNTKEKLLEFIEKHLTVEPMVWDMLNEMPYNQLVTYIDIKLEKYGLSAK